MAPKKKTPPSKQKAGASASRKRKAETIGESKKPKVEAQPDGPAVPMVDQVEALLNDARLRHLEAVDAETLGVVEKDLKGVVELTSSVPTMSSQCDLALQRLALLLCQQERFAEAATYLRRLGCAYRLSREVLCSAPATDIDAAAAWEAAPFVAAVDDVLPPAMLAVMRRALAPTSEFWSEHSYDCETSDFFSYLHCLTDPPISALDQVLGRLHQVVGHHFPAAKEAKFVEWWTHCRPHPSGHQLHFDSADEGRGTVRNPIVSSVLYLSEGNIGGPTLVTRQRRADQRLAGDGWLVFPRLNRYCVFNGEVLHGVIPGRGVPEGGNPGELNRRVTFMAAFWKDSGTARPHGGGAKTGSAEPFPDPAACPQQWPRAFLPLLPSAPALPQPPAAPVAPVASVWEDVDAAENRRRQCLLASLAGLPPYDACFQGF